MQAMASADLQARWLMQAWLFYDNQEFWKPPQIKVCSARLRLMSVPKALAQRTGSEFVGCVLSLQLLVVRQSTRRA